MGFWQWEQVDHIEQCVDVGGWTREKWGGGADRGRVDMLGGGGDVCLDLVHRGTITATLIGEPGWVFSPLHLLTPTNQLKIPSFGASYNNNCPPTTDSHTAPHKLDYTYSSLGDTTPANTALISSIACGYHAMILVDSHVFLFFFSFVGGG
jgi:hypothetical protein